VEVRILGPLHVEGDAGIIDLGAPRVQSLLAILVLRAPRAVSVEDLVDGIWGESPPESAKHLVQVYVSQLRQRLGATSVTTHAAGYALALPESSIDVTAFGRCVQAARASRAEGRLAESLREYDEALSCWRGHVAAGTVVYGGATSLVARLDEAHFTASEERIDVSLALGQNETVIPELRQLTLAHPLSESICAKLMIALYRSGRQADSLSAYQDTRRALTAVGLEPGPKLRAIERSVLQQDPDLLVASPQEAPVTPALTSETPVTERRRSKFIWLAPAVVVVIAGITAMLVPAAGRHHVPKPTVPRHSLGEIDAASGKLVGSVRVGPDPGPVSAAGGKIWVGDLADKTLSGVDAPTLRVGTTVGIARVPNAMQAAGRAVWIGNSFDGTVTRVDTVTNLVSSPRRPEPSSTGRLVLAYGAGSLWVASQDRRLVRLDPGTGRLLARLSRPFGPQSLALGYGSLWIGLAARVGVMRASESTPAARIVPIGGRAFSVAAGAGSVWALTPENGELWRIDPRDDAVTGKIHLPAPQDVVTAGDSVWVTSTNGTLLRIDPRRLTVDRRIPLAGPPGGLTAGNGRVWVTVD
jgi:DNA-binding SARP family transcriptional activator